MTMAKFPFNPVLGKSSTAGDLIVDVAPSFTKWYASPESIESDSQFTYTQAFNLSTDAKAVGNVTVTPFHAIGGSPEATTP